MKPIKARTSQIGELGQPINSVGVDNLMWLGAKCTERTTDQFGDVLRFLICFMNKD